MSATAAPPKPAPLAVKGPPAAAEFDRPTNVNGLQRLGDSIMPQIKAALPGMLASHAPRMLRCLLTECQRTPKLLDCKPRSLLGAVIQVAQLGLELGGPAGQAYLIPFKGDASLVIGYKGFITLAHRSGKVRRISPRIVREGDTFQVEYGTGQMLRHAPAAGDHPNAKPTHYYAVVELDNGGTDFEVLTVAQAAAHRDRFALSKSGPWATSFDEMALKTCIRRLAKRLPLSVEWVAAASLDDMAEEEVPQRLSAAVVIEGDPADDGDPLLDKWRTLKDGQPAGDAAE